MIVVISLFFFSACANSTEPITNTSTTSSTTTSTVSDHIVSEKGVMHKNGLNSASTNCVSCHGSDLKGGTSGISCYSCHSKVWS